LAIDRFNPPWSSLAVVVVVVVVVVLQAEASSWGP
jgi:hypothetical protein